MAMHKVLADLLEVNRQARIPKELLPELLSVNRSTFYKWLSGDSEPRENNLWAVQDLTEDIDFAVIAGRLPLGRVSTQKLSLIKMRYIRRAPSLFVRRAL